MANKWSTLNHLQLGRYAEYFAKMEFTKKGNDVFTAEVDDKGIDFLIRKNDKEYFDIQNKSIRFPNTTYVFMPKDKFKPRNNLYLSLIIFEENEEPILLLIPSMDWINKKYNFLVEREYEGKKSKPEWGINITKSNIDKIKSNYHFDEQITNL